MRVIEHGALWLKEHNKGIQLCSNCGCKFEYDLSDRKWKRVTDVTLKKYDITVVTCPECNQDIGLKAWDNGYHEPIECEI